MTTLQTIFKELFEKELQKNPKAKNYTMEMVIKKREDAYVWFMSGIEIAKKLYEAGALKTGTKEIS